MTALLALILALMMTVGACSEALPAEEPAEPFGSPWVNSIALGNLPETAPDLKDDFYTAVNYDVLKANQDAGYYYPLGESAGESEAAVRALLQDSSLAGDEITQLRVFWEQAADMDALRDAGYAPATPYLERVDAAASIDELNAVLTAEDFPFSPFVAMPVAPLAMNEESGVWIFPALSMSSDYGNGSNYYTEPAEDITSLMTKLTLMDRTWYLSAVMAALGVGNDAFFDTLMNFYNTEVSYVSKEYSDVVAATADYGYLSNAMERLSMEDLDRLCSRFPLTATLKKFGKDTAPAFVTLCSDWMKALDDLWTEENLERLKSLTRFKILMECAPYLYSDVNNTVRAVNELPPLDAESNPWNVCNRPDTFAHLLGRIYMEQVLGNELKEQLTSMTEDLIDTFTALFYETEWLSEDGLEKALEKLANIRLNILEPDGGFYDFSGLKLTSSAEGGSLFTNYLVLKAYLNEQENRSIGKPAKANLVWKIYKPLDVNCFYDPFSNSINILPGFIYSYILPKDVTEAQMLGSVGTVIAHELTHAFDYCGSQRDAYGRGIAILTEADLETFLSRVKTVEEYYSTFIILPDVHCDGALTRVENTADVIGVQAAARLAKSKGLDLQAFFREHARIFAMAMPENYVIALLADTHAMNYLRVNVSSQMTDEFYEAFDIQEGDGMYVKPEERLRIWGR